MATAAATMITVIAATSVLAVPCCYCRRCLDGFRGSGGATPSLVVFVQTLSAVAAVTLLIRRVIMRRRRIVIVVGVGVVVLLHLYDEIMKQIFLKLKAGRVAGRVVASRCAVKQSNGDTFESPVR